MAANGNKAGLAVPTTNSFDELDASVLGCLNTHFARAESMDVSNDPRFFTKNVMDKRLSAFKSLTIVSSLMFGTSIGHCFSLKKDMDFSKYVPYVGYIAWWQIIGFFLSMIVASMCLLSLYVMAHQAFYTYRLMTAGPTGFEQASVFYLTKAITMWRHLAMKALFNGLWLFMVSIGMQLFVLFYKDADKAMKKQHGLMVLNLVNGTSQQAAAIDLPGKEHKLDMTVHSALAYAVFASFAIFALLLLEIRRQHISVFKLNYYTQWGMTRPIQNSLATMSQRAGSDVEM